MSFVCFLFGAFLPIIPWFIGSGGAASWASLLIGMVAAGVVGALVARFAERPLHLGVARQVLIVIVACGVTWLIGDLAGVSLGG